jgi:hypothetical protein
MVGQTRQGVAPLIRLAGAKKFETNKARDEGYVE